MLTDITERKRAEQALRSSEQRFRGLFENVLEGVYQSTPDGRILAANPMLLTMLGMVTENEMNDVNIARDLYVDQGVRRRLLNRLEREGSFQNVEYELRRRDGAIITVRENARAVRDDEGKVIYYEGTLSDVTEQIHIESELLKARSRDSVEAIAGNMPHEFRNVLTVISGYSRLLLEDLSEDHPARTAARGIARIVEEAEALTAQLAAFSERPEQAMVDVNRVLLFSEGAPRRNLSPWSLPVHADTDDVRRIVTSLSRDAQEVTADAVHVDLAFARTHAGSRAGLFARITARSSGPDADMAPETAAAVSKCRGFVLDSETGRAVYLPIAETAARFLTSRVAAPRPREIVLLVQEEPLVREVSRDLLERLGYGVLLAEDAAEAERIAAQGYGFDLVIADMHETRIAAELIRGLKAVKPELKVIAITAKTARREIGADGYLERPFSSESLNNEIRRLLK
jgi:PAS domain S-box-containing protein